MKKIMFVAAMASIAFASCSQEESLDNGNEQSVANAQTEITVNPFNRRMSRGYVTTSEFKQLNNPAIDPTPSVNRTMHISAYNATDNTDYFIDKIFAEKDGHSGVWGAVGKAVYWPLAKTLDFLAYSQSEVAPIEYKVPAILATWKSANEVELEVTKDSRQDDILYAAAWGLNANNSNSTQGFGMKFDHAQAWLTFKLSLTTGSEKGILKINSIRWKDVYESGMLTLKNEGADKGQATATWDFFTQTPTDVIMDDPFKVLDKNEGDPVSTYDPAGALGEGTKILNMLIPAQDHTGLVINYTMNGVTNEMEVAAQEFENTGSTWAKGIHYIYNLAFTVNEITVAPTVNIWDEVSTEWTDLGENNEAYLKIVRQAAEAANTEGGSNVTVKYEGTDGHKNINVSAEANMEKFLSAPDDPNENNAFWTIRKFCETLKKDPVTFIYYKGKKYEWSTTTTPHSWFSSERGLSLEASLATDFYPVMQTTGVAVAYISLNDEQTVVLTMKRTDVSALFAKIRTATDAIVPYTYGTVLATNTGLMVNATAHVSDFTQGTGDVNDNPMFKALTEFLKELGDADYSITTNCNTGGAWDTTAYTWDVRNEQFVQESADASHYTLQSHIATFGYLQLFPTSGTAVNKVEKIILKLSDGTNTQVIFLSIEVVDRDLTPAP